jgi:Cu(I)/Ag(I) efflux system membrane fusion protein
LVSHAHEVSIMTEQKLHESETGQVNVPVNVRAKRRKTWPLVALACAASVLVGLTVGFLLGTAVPDRRGPGPEATSPKESAPEEATTWTCSMHPQIQLPKPGKCPICFMDLIPLAKDSRSERGPRELKMSREAMALADVQTERVKRQYVANLVRMVGKVDYDETRLVDVTARVPGRLDRLYVDYTFTTVRKGDHLVYLYSPELVVAQRELLQSWRAYNKLSNAGDRELVAANLRSAEQKLRLWGLLDEQIEAVKQRGTTSDHMTIYAPVGGIVAQKHVNEGVYVREGTTVYTIADLAQVWVLLDAYESDVPWLRYGQEVEFTTETYPGEIFKGRIALIAPVLNENSRTVSVRVNVPNGDFRLKPGMFVRALVRSRLAAGGRVLDASLAGKWICPMHPEIVKDGPGQCDVCGMDLVPAEQLGFVAREKPAEPPLVIPVTAPLRTGKRAVVYVKLPDRQQPTFEGREVLLGYRAGDYYLVRDGLEEGEEVVTKGNFKIDSALQIRARPSMMSPEGGATAASHRRGEEPIQAGQGDDHAADEAGPIPVPSAFRTSLNPLYEAYLQVADALAADDFARARKALGDMPEAIAQVDVDLLESGALDRWRAARTDLDQAFQGNWEPSDIDDLRQRFETVSRTVLGIVEGFGHALGEPLYKAFCPMALQDKGASWLQAGKTIANPYFGHTMLRCGEIRQEFPPAAPGDEHQHREGGHDEE